VPNVCVQLRMQIGICVGRGEGVKTDRAEVIKSGRGGGEREGGRYKVVGKG
jgi:hypothetical protein